MATVTVRDFWERWTTDPLFARPKDSTNIHNRERTRALSVGLTASERYEASDALHGEKASGDIQADMTYGKLLAWLRQWRDRWQPS